MPCLLSDSSLYCYFIFTRNQKESSKYTVNYKEKEKFSDCMFGVDVMPASEQI